ncbi:MAG: hypothetical protein WBE31_15660, partial [Candidatus Sulfotelmatobacter sp.]
AVLKVFPIIGSHLFDVTPCGEMQFGPFWEFAVDGDIPPSPSVYWNHDVREKLRADLLESIVCGQNLENKIVPVLLCQ